jgi:hypothetical protein
MTSLIAGLLESASDNPSELLDNRLSLSIRSANVWATPAVCVSLLWLRSATPAESPEFVRRAVGLQGHEKLPVSVRLPNELKQFHPFGHNTCEGRR